LLVVGFCVLDIFIFVTFAFFIIRFCPFLFVFIRLQLSVVSYVSSLDLFFSGFSVFFRFLVLFCPFCFISPLEVLSLVFE